MGNLESLLHSFEGGGSNFKVISLDDIETHELLGRGALCQVHRARWKSRDLDVALKTFFCPDLSSEDLDDFRRELSVTRELGESHPNIIKYWAGCSDPPRLYLLLELMPHGTLHDLLFRDETPLPHRFVLRILREICCGMAFLHTHGLLHRDLKPENVLLAHDDEDVDVPMVRIADFGISTMHDPAQRPVMTKMRGTTQWMAPEVLAGRTDYGFPVDIYSFGVLAWQTLTRRMPYDDVEAFRVADHVLGGARPPISPQLRETMGELVRLIEECWAEDPEDRPSFLEAQERVEALEAVHLESIGVVKQAAAPRRPRARSMNHERGVDPHHGVDQHAVVEENAVFGLSAITRKSAHALRRGRSAEPDALDPQTPILNMDEAGEPVRESELRFDSAELTLEFGTMAMGGRRARHSASSSSVSPSATASTSASTSASSSTHLLGSGDRLEGVRTVDPRASRAAERRGSGSPSPSRARSSTVSSADLAHSGGGGGGLNSSGDLFAFDAADQRRSSAARIDALNAGRRAQPRSPPESAGELEEGKGKKKKRSRIRFLTAKRKH